MTLTPQQILFIHYRLIEATGGAPGVRDLAALQAAAARPLASLDGADLYPDVFAKAAALMESLIKDHPFVDGNKRVAITSAAMLLRQHRMVVVASQDDLIDFTMAMATGELSVSDAAGWFRRHTSKR